MKKPAQTTPWREPPQESIGLFPGLVVHDGRVSGSITIGRSRLPLWAIITTAIRGTWDNKPDSEWASVMESWPMPEGTGYTDEHLAHFMYCLCELRGDFARLLLVLAQAESMGDGGAWWEKKTHRRRVAKQMRRCLAILEANDA